MKSFILVITILAGAGACGDGGGGGVVQEMCQRADECNALPSSEGECIEYIESCVEELTPSQRDEWEYLMQECLERPTCDGAFDCYYEVPWC